MKISHFNTFPYGGAAYAARRLHDGLCLEGADSTFFYWKNDREPLDSSYRQIEFEPASPGGLFRPIAHQVARIRQRRIKRRYDDQIRPREHGLEVFSAANLLNPTRLHSDQINADVVNLHWTAFMIDYPTFFDSIDDRTPIVWTVHDMNPLTGGCHYSSGCERFKLGCGHCPQLVKSSANDESAISFQTKRKSLRNKNLTIVAPSQWMLNLARSTDVFPERTRFEQIRYGFDLEELKPLDKYIARRQLGIDGEDCVVVGFGAEDINHHRKGFHLLLEALKNLSANAQIKCLVFGSGELPGESADLPEVISVGFVDSVFRKALVYSAMDMFVMPSLEDNSPQTGLESMACGTPVVAFAAGGIPEYVKQYETGITVPVGNVDQLAESISWLSDNPVARAKMSDFARQFVVKHHRIDLQTRQYLKLYRDLLGMDSIPMPHPESTIQSAAA